MAGRGRGAILEILKKKQEEELKKKLEEEERRQAENEKIERSQEKEQNVIQAEEKKQFDTPVPIPKGRGSSILSALKKSARSSESSSPVTSAAASVTSTQTTSTSSGPGRGSGIQNLLKKKPGLDTSAESSGVTGKLETLSLEETKSSIPSEPEICSRQGESGRNVRLSANYIRLKVNDSKGMFQYEVKFNPDIDSRNLRFRLLNQHLNELGNVKTFDGALLYLPVQLPENRTVFQSAHPVDGSTVELTVIFKKKMAMRENIAFFNTLMNRVLRALTLVRIGRHDFNPTAAHKIPQHRLEVWPGYISAINQLEGGLLLNLDATHRVMRLDTVRDMMTDIYKKNPRDFKRAVMNEIIGTSVLTRYNNRTYKIDDIDWDNNPEFKFEKKDETLTLVDYYRQHYEIQIQDLKQPLLVHRSKEKKTTGETIERIHMLVPELCFLAGMTDSIRKDFKITKDLSVVTKVNPEQRRAIIKNFIQQVNGNEVTRKILSDWGLEIESDTVDLQGRVLDPEEITFGNDYKTKSANADWGRAAISSAVLRTPNMPNWAIVCTQMNQKNCNDFLETFKGVCNKVKIKIGQPIIGWLNNDNIDSYVNKLRELAKNSLNMVVVILPTARQDKYSAIKKICCVECPVPSQVIIAKTISRPDKIKSVVEKIALQINCKLGGSLWAVVNPYKTAMVCGIDVYHAGAGQGPRGSVAAFVASLDKMLTSWHSRTCIQAPNQELVDMLKQCLNSAIRVFREKNGQYPEKIFIYRDGVGDGQLDVVKNYEVKQFLDTCSRIDPSYKPQIIVIIVQKRVNTRIFLKGSDKLENPPPGTILDSTVTRRYLYDFYLVPQLVRQGTVTPTHYIVLHDGANLKTDHVQRFTYKLCHLYYNWPGTIRVPAPCQYAHKLAYLVGQSVRSEPSSELNNLLYYL